MSDLPLAEINLRKYEPPYNLGKRELVKKVCLSLGLLQPGDSRDVMVDILLVLLDARKDKEMIDLPKIKRSVLDSRKAANCEMKGVADSNIRRQLRRLKDLMLVEKLENRYRISEFDSLENLFEDKINNFYLPSIVSRVKEYMKAIESDSKKE